MVCKKSQGSVGISRILCYTILVANKPLLNQLTNQIPMKKTLTLTGALTLAVLMAACGQKADDTEAAAPAAAASAAAEKASAPASVPKEGEVIVAPVSKVASAPGIDPLDASTLPPMPKIKPVMLDKDGKPVAIPDATASAPAKKK